ncbi:hypothetical protein [Altererythrobacter aquiaggeris]|uniref:hypothetical protein n=1 Tax=Aestuarierythrobacter aquiaggeris TaxID=1898396 RepID=UPI00301ADC6C
MAKHITEKGAAKVNQVAESLPGNAAPIPGPSPNAATNLILSDIAMRSGGRLVRMAVEKGILRTRFNPQLAKDIVQNRGLVSTLASYGVSKIATRSVPGAVLVGGGLLVKTLFDRSQSKRKARRSGDKTLRKMAEKK